MLGTNLHMTSRGVREEIWDCLSFGHKPEINAEFPRGPEELELKRLPRNIALLSGK